MTQFSSEYNVVLVHEMIRKDRASRTFPHTATEVAFLIGESGTGNISVGGGPTRLGDFQQAVSVRSMTVSVIGSLPNVVALRGFNAFKKLLVHPRGTNTYRTRR